MQSVSSRIWTRVAMSISYDDNRYTTGTSTNKWYNRHFDIAQLFQFPCNVQVVILPFAFF